MRTVTTSIRVKKEVLDVCDQVAAEMNMTRSALITTIVERVCYQLKDEIDKKGGKNGKK